MTRYLKMPITPNNPVYSFDAFKAAYLALTGEKIQDTPLENEQGTHYLVGSFRLTGEQAIQLADQFPPVTITDTVPVGWVTKEVV